MEKGVHNMGWFESEVWHWTLVWKRNLRNYDENCKTFHECWSKSSLGRRTWSLGVQGRLRAFAVKASPSGALNQTNPNVDIASMISSAWIKLVPQKVGYGLAGFAWGVEHQGAAVQERRIFKMLNLLYLLQSTN